MEYTEFSEVYIRFLSKIEDTYIASLSDKDLGKALYPILLSAINTFARISEHDIRNRDDESGTFNAVLTNEEIEVLAILMRPDWLQRYINSSRKIQQQYYDAGIKTYSPNENLRNLTVLYQQYLSDSRKAITEYTKSTVSIVGNFGGLPKGTAAHRAYTPGHTIHNGDEDDPLSENV